MQKVHFIGICGAGMSAVAILLKEQGMTVTGSDEGAYPPVSDLLVAHGIPFATSYAAANIPASADTIIIGKHSRLTPEENEEVRAAFASGLPVLSFPQVLEKLTEEKRRIVVAGSYGKSTCSALMAWCLERAGKDPGYFIGAATTTPKESAYDGSGNIFVFEGDEYPAANWDPTSKFLYYHPHHLLLTALAHDHINVFPTHRSYIEPFLKLVEELPPDGLLVTCVDDPTALSHAATWKNKKGLRTYGLDTGATWRAKRITYGDSTTFDLVGPLLERPLRFTTTLLGAHNVQNIVGVAALLLEAGLLAPDEIRDGVASFKELHRRLDRVSRTTRIPVYEGFGSSYEKARAAIDAMRLHFPTKRLIVVFEPHTFSWRNRGSLRWYDTAFQDAERVFIYKPPETGAHTHDQLGLHEIVRRIHEAHMSVYGFEETEEGLKHIMAEVKNGDVLLILTSGDMGGLIPKMVAALEERFPTNK